MKKLAHKSVLMMALLAGLTAGAWAQPASGSCPGHEGGAHMGHMGHKGGCADPAKMAERHKEHLTQLKAKLKLTAAQEGAWTTFTTSMQPPANRPDMKAQREEMSKLTTPERLDKMQGMKAQRDAEMNKRTEAIKAFYAQLSPEQKKVFDTESARHGERDGHGPRAGHGPHGKGGMNGPGSAASQPK